MKKKEKKDVTSPIQSEDIPKHTKKTVIRLFARLAKQKHKLFIVMAAALLSCAAFTLIPLMVGVAIDNLLMAMRDPSNSGSIVSTISTAIGLPVMLIAAASIISSLFAYLQQYIIASVGETLTLSLRKDISSKINKLPLRYFDSHQTGEIMGKATNDLEKVSEVMQTGLMQFITAFFTILLTATMMLVLSPKLFLLGLITISISTIATHFVSNLSQKCYAENLAAVSDLNEKVEEFYTGNKIIKVFNQQSKVIDSVLELNQKQFKANRRAQFVIFSIYPLIRFINLLGFAATAVAGGLMVLQGQISLGTVQAYLQYVNQISEPVTEAAYVITSLQSAIAGAERVFALLDEPEEVKDSDLKEFAATKGSVEFKNVKFGYSPENILIKDLNLAVQPNEMVAIVGPTGGGKTTLINLIMRFYELNGGSISIDGINITKVPRSLLRRKIGMVLQDAWLFEGTIAENISYGKMDVTREEVEDAAKAACCHHFIRTLPHGYDTVISGDAAGISQGQMQLLTIARAMLTNPTIMILDEATSSVDTRTEVEIQKAMTRLMKDKTSFVIAHRLSTIQNADMILVVRDGNIVERGTHETLLSQKGFYASLYYSQFEEAPNSEA